MNRKVKAFPLNKGMTYQEGMDLRDYFASKAMQAMIGDGDDATIASWAYQMADAMMEAREK